MSAHAITVSVTPLCTSCGAELHVGCAQARETGHPFDRDDPSERVAQRVFVYACTACFIYKNDRDAIAAAAQAHTEGRQA